jgi:hypothetical protein
MHTFVHAVVRVAPSDFCTHEELNYDLVIFCSSRMVRQRVYMYVGVFPKCNSQTITESFAGAKI